MFWILSRGIVTYGCNLITRQRAGAKKAAYRVLTDFRLRSALWSSTRSNTNVMQVAIAGNNNIEKYFMSAIVLLGLEKTTEGASLFIQATPLYENNTRKYLKTTVLSLLCRHATPLYDKI